MRERARSFRFAFRGIARMVRTDHNAWIHAVATVAVVAAGFYFRVSVIEWCLLVLAMAAVWCAEFFNTAVEALGDAISPGENPKIAAAKDVAAGAVLVAAIGAVIVGLLVFAPKLLRLL